jgi:DNA replication and repair protein RecF
MIIASLEATNFRNLRRVSLECSAGLNLLIGENASGKTSLLEAIYYLGRAKSFRTRLVRELIRHDAKALRVVATIDSTTRQRPVPIGIERSSRELIARVDRQPIRSMAELATWLPVLLLNPDSHRLLEDGPQHRRRFMDWGLFHREAQFLTAWRRYRSALQHRNAALRSSTDGRSMAVWEQELVSAAIPIDQFRKSFCQALEGALTPLLEEILGQFTLQLEYRRGWAQDHELLDLLQRERTQDRFNGHTRAGPHRADFSIRLSGRTFAEQLSRGQQKLLVIALVLAQARLYQQQRGEPCVLLLDDLPAELDQSNRARMMVCLARQDLQLFVTAIESSDLPIKELWQEKAKRVFKLTHGELSEVV